MSLAETLRRNTLWVLAGEIGARVAQFGFGVILARLLLPSDFGLVVTVQLLTGALGFIAAHGINDALVRAQSIDRRDIDTVFTIQFGIGAAIVTVLNLIAPQFAELFNDGRLEPLLRLAAMTFLLRPLIGVPSALLQRANRFKALSGLIVVEVLISGLSAVLYVVLDFGAWGLLMGGLSGTVARTLAAMVITRWRPAFGFDRRSAHRFGAFGMKISINEIIQYARIQTANALISRTLGMTKVGLYNKADSLAEMPFEILGGSAYQTLFRTLASIQDQRAQSARLFLDSAATVTFYALPLYLGLPWVAEPLIVTIYGSQWADAATALQILALVGPLRVLSTLSRAVVAAHNRLGREIFVQLETWALLLVGVLIGLRWGLPGVALGVLPAFVFNAIRLYGLADRILATGWGGLWRALRPVLELNLLLLAGLAATSWALSATGLDASKTLYLAVMIACGGTIYGGVFLLCPPKGLEDEWRRWKSAIRSIASMVRAALDRSPIRRSNGGTFWPNNAVRNPNTTMKSTRSLRDHLRLLTDLGLWLAAAGILLILAVRALVSIDSSHDTWWYHLPWAARLAGLLPADAFVYDSFLEQRFSGFPVLWEWLQGLAWRLTGRPETANLLSLASLLLFLGFLRARFRVPLHLGFLGLIAVPLIQIHATVAYVDLPANLALAAALLLLPSLFQADNPRRRPDMVLLVLTCALSANIKLQLVPATALVFVAGVVATILAWRRDSAGPGAWSVRTLTGAVGLVLAFAVIFFVPLKNLATYGNPFYPVALKAGPIAFSGPQVSPISHTDRLKRLIAARSSEQPDARPAERAKAPTGTGHEPQAAASASHVSAFGDPGRWLASVLEIGMEPLLGRGEWNLAGVQEPPLPHRHGGFFGWYVLLNLLLFGVLAARRLRRNAGWLILFAAASLVNAFLPHHEILRYYLFWIILLVSLNLIMLRPAPPMAPASAATDMQRASGVVALAAFLLVVYATRAEFFQPRFYFVEDLIETRRAPTVLAAVQQHPRTCLAGERPPRVFIYSRLFNPDHDYRLKTGPTAGHYADELDLACGPDWTQVIAERDDAGLLPARRGGARSAP